MNKKLITMTFLATLGTLFNTAHATDEYYKWVDARGVTHYSQNQPDDDKIKAERVSISTHIPRGSQQAISDLQQQRAELKKETKEKTKEGVTKTGKNAKVDVSKAPADYQEKCTTLKQDLASLTQNGSRVNIKEADGSLRKLSSEEINQRLDETKRQIKAFCE